MLLEAKTIVPIPAPENDSEAPLDEVAANELHVCPISHRRARRFFSTLIMVLIVAVVALVIYCVWSARQ